MTARGSLSIAVADDLAAARSVPGLSWRGLARAAANVGRALLLVAAAFGLVGIRNPTSAAHYAAGFLLCAVAAVATLGMRRELAWGVAYLVAFAAFSYIRAAADETGIAPHYGYPVTLERAIPGPLPTRWLQDRLWSPGVSTFDQAMSAVHLSYFIVPHAVALAIWRWRGRLTARYVVSLMLALYGATLFAALLPTAPPWMAAEAGLISPVAKVTDFVYGANGVDGYTGEIVRMNAVAAMPSLHFAVTAVAVAGLWQFGTMARVLGSLYLVAMGFALVYLGEHYLVDLVGGAVAALVAWHAATRAVAVCLHQLRPTSHQRASDARTFARSGDSNAERREVVG